MSNQLNESIVVWIHSGGVPINKKCVADHDVNDSIVYILDLFPKSLFFHHACCYHTLFKTQLMHYNLKYTLKTH